MDYDLTRVYAAIDSELKYQEEKYGKTLSSNRTGNGERTLDEFALYIYGYANDLMQTASHKDEPKEKLDIVRKIAALCVNCMEQHGSPFRV